jgi:hypothetical protein
VTTINIPKDDIAVRDAQNRNSSTPEVQEPRAAAPTKPLEPVAPHQTMQPPRTAIRQRNKKDRRQGDRRKKQVKVLLDTRSQRERRKKSRRGTDLKTTEETQDKHQKGIDVYS